MFVVVGRVKLSRQRSLVCFPVFLGEPFLKRFALSYQTVVCLSCLPVYNVGVLWPNCWMHQDATWYGDRPRPHAHCARWGPSPLPKKEHSPFPQFSAHVCCGQTAGWIKMPLGTKVGLGPGHIVLHGDPAVTPKKGHSALIFGPFLFWPNGRLSQLLLSTCSFSD